MRRKTRTGTTRSWWCISNVYWLKAKVLGGKADSKLLCNMDSVDMQSPEDQAKRTDHAASSSLVQQLNIQEELIQAEAYGPKIRARLWKGTPPEA